MKNKKPVTRREFIYTSAAAAALASSAIKAEAFAERAEGDAALVASGTKTQWTPSDLPNSPIGIGRGIHPGRVTFIRDSRAARWDGTSGRWWDSGNIDEAALANMFAKSLVALSGAPTDKEAWTADRKSVV